MKHWQETERILDRVVRLTGQNRVAALAVVVRVEGSAYRRPGAKLLIEDDGATMGSVSGGCLEADVREVGFNVMRGGLPRLLHYDTGDDGERVWGLGLGCNGAVDIFVQPITIEGARAVAERARELLKGQAPFAVSTVVAGPTAVGRGVVLGAEGMLAGSTGDSALDREVASRTTGVLRARSSTFHRVGPAQVFTEVLVPPPILVICGAGDDAIPLAASAAGIGFRVIIADHRPAYLAPGRFPEASRLIRVRPEEDLGELPLGPKTYVVVKTHSLALDREWVRRLLATEVPHIGLLGPRSRTERILEGVDESRRHRLFGPVGLDLGAEGPEQVALSIVAELLCVWSGREPRHLREKEGPIHATC